MRYDQVEKLLKRLNEKEDMISTEQRRTLMVTYVAAVLSANLNEMIKYWQADSDAQASELFQEPVKLFQGYEAAIDRARLARSKRINEAETDQSSSSS